MTKRKELPRRSSLRTRNRMGQKKSARGRMRCSSRCVVGLALSDTTTATANSKVAAFEAARALRAHLRGAERGLSMTYLAAAAWPSISSGVERQQRHAS